MSALSRDEEVRLTALKVALEAAHDDLGTTAEDIVKAAIIIEEYLRRGKKPE